MVKKFYILFMLASFLVFLGCNDDKKKQTNSFKKNEIIISVGSSITSGGFDPIKGYGHHEPDIFHSTLLKFNKKIELINDIVKSYKISDDGKTYTFVIRDDIKFSDGKPLGVEDIIFTYNSAKSSGSLVDLNVLKSVEKKSDTEVVFTLTRPYSVFLRTVALIGIVPKHAYNENYGNKPIGSRAWKVAELKLNEQLILVPNEFYYGNKPKLKKVTILNLDEDIILAVAKSGQLDVAMINPEYSKEKISNMKLLSLKTVDTRGFNLPVISEFKSQQGKIIGNNVTSDIAIRKALNIGIDRQNIINNALNGIGDIAFSRTSNLPWTNNNPQQFDNQTNKAIKILEDAGWIDINNDGIREKNGVRAEFSITGRADDLQRYNLAVALSQDAKKLGINIKATSKTWSLAKEDSYNNPTCWGIGSYTPIDLFYAYGTAPTNINNPSSYSKKSVDEYFDKALMATDENEAIKYWQNAQWDTNDGINADFPYVWLVNIRHTYFVKNGLNIGEQYLHPHGHGVPIIANLEEWTY